MIRRFMKAACALAAIAFSMETMAAEDAALAQWRMAMATNGYDAVRGRVKVPQDVRQSIWKAYREHIGYEGVQMSKPKLVSTNEFGAVYDLPFTTSDGATYNYGVSVADGTVRPMYLTACGMSAQDRVSLASAVLSTGAVTNNLITEVRQTLDSSCARLVGGISQRGILSPFCRFFAFMSDDMPMADWHHPTRFLLVSEDNTSFAVLYGDEPFEVLVNGEDVQMTILGENPSATAKSQTRSHLLLAASQGQEFDAVAAGDSSRCFCYALYQYSSSDGSVSH